MLWRNGRGESHLVIIYFIYEVTAAVLGDNDNGGDI
jgi:hypothetical protein